MAAALARAAAGRTRRIARSARGALRAGAAGDAHVHELRLVLLRGVRPGDGADPQVRRARPSARARRMRRRPRGALQGGAGAGALEHSRAHRRAPRLRAGGAALHRLARHGRRALRHRGAGGGLPQAHTHLLPRGPDQLPPARGRRHRGPLARPHRGPKPDHAGADRSGHSRSPFCRGRFPLRRQAERAGPVRTQRGPPLRVVQPAVARAGGPRDRPRIPRAGVHLARPLPRRAPRGCRAAPAGDDGSVRERLPADLRRQPAADRLLARDRFPGATPATSSGGRGGDTRGGGGGAATRHGQARPRAGAGRAGCARAARAAARSAHRFRGRAADLRGRRPWPLREGTRRAARGRAAGRGSDHARHAPRHAPRSVDDAEHALGGGPQRYLASRRRGARPARPRALVRRVGPARPRGGGAPHAGLGMTAAIGDHAIVGDCRSAALISRDGSLDWLCWPRFDSPSLFAAILDEDRGGRFGIAPAGPFRSERGYLGETNVLQTRFFAASGELSVTDFMPALAGTDALRQPQPGHELVRIARCERGEVGVAIVFDPRPDYGRFPPRIRSLGKLGLRVDAGGGAMLTLLTDAPLGPEGRARVQLRGSEELHFSLGYVCGAPAVLPPPTATRCASVLDGTLRLWREWASRTRYDGPERAMVVRSALLLRLLQYAPSGAIVAAPTTSLPERPGGDLQLLGGGVPRARRRQHRRGAGPIRGPARIRQRRRALRGGDRSKDRRCPGELPPGVHACRPDQRRSLHPRPPGARQARRGARPAARPRGAPVNWPGSFLAGVRGTLLLTTIEAGAQQFISPA